MNALKKTLSIFIALVLILLPMAFLCVAAILLPDPYEKSFVGALDEKYDLLMNTQGEKIIIVGGSSVAFGVRSDIIEEYTDMPVVNFGLYAALGTKLMLDLSRQAVGEGDIVIVTPELNEQTLSLYFNSRMTLRAISGRADMFLALPTDDKLSLLSALWDYTAEKLEYYIMGINGSSGTLNPTGVYNADNFNRWGDLVYERSENIMPSYYDANNMISPVADIISDEFIDYLNEYVAYCENRGATVYFNFCPMNEMGFLGGYDEEALSSFADYLESVIDCDLIGTPMGSVLGAGYFYDTNFHLGDAGAIKYTARLTEDILFELDIPRAVTLDIPDEPALPLFDSYLDVYDENEKYFIFEQLPDGSYAISGLTELGMAAQKLTVPIAHNSRRVTRISQNALVGISAGSLVITEDTSLRAIADGAFSGAGTLTDLWIYFKSEELLLPPSSFIGVPLGFTVHIPENSGYASGYYWGERGLNFVYDANE